MKLRDSGNVLQSPPYKYPLWAKGMVTEAKFLWVHLIIVSRCPENKSEDENLNTSCYEQ